MRTHAVARRYARAMFALAEQLGMVDDVAAALGAIADLMEDPRLSRVLTGPVPRESKEELLRTIAAQTGAPAPLRDLLLLLAARGRLSHLGAIRAVFTELVDRREGRARATVRSAAPLSDDLLGELVRVFGGVTGKRLHAEVQIDPELLAGVIVEIDGRVYDGSLRLQLDRLRRQMATGT